MPEGVDVLVHEMGLRDGLQSIETIFSTEGKMDWIRAEAESGVPQLQVGSFVPPKLLPQMADSADVVRQAIQIPDLVVSALAPNLKGAKNAMEAGAHQVGVVMSISEAHNMSNVRRSTKESLEDFKRIVEYRDSNPAYNDVCLSGGMATAFGCTISGPVSLPDVMRIAEQLLKAGANRLNVADTVGYANPGQVRDLFTELYRTVGRDVAIGAHFHDTRGLGLANAFAALETGVRELDASLGGLGGCPYAPGASGNIVTEDLVFMLESMGMRTGVDLKALLKARKIMECQLKGEPTHGTFAKAGLPLGFAYASAA
ncbi:MAG: hydroxymethylglutaryl-CoA lyase [Rhodospirillaceae bacterium TMED8]|mgnify:CR=1 FL=1|nr:hydroxymethylglutaryl-CoA lyase [Magnetovibrio sp.]OUT51167.1 MAG: hydroxymethylglutaryl-CoA lyase [Rhodospirillaceae bacterium TMED8]|tara:strand:- start:1842 stop:2783 length:942 start_codon:yes stop_codon:yes gene_type:complete